MKIIIDTDMLIDDWIAILYLLQNKNVEVIGVSVTGTGGCYLESGGKNALALLKLANLDSKVPVCMGAHTPLLYSNLYPTAIRNHAKNFMGIPIPPSSATLDTRELETFYSDLITQSQEPVGILSIGGASNFGIVLPKILQSPDIRSKIEHVYIMGGAVDVKGNLYQLTDLYNFNQVAEWNVFVDVKSMSMLVKSGLPITLVPLDACNEVIFNKDFAKKFRSQAQGTLTPWVSDMLDAYLGSTDSVNVFDPLAAVTLANPQSSLVKIETISLSVDQLMKVSGEADTAGKTRRDEKGSSTQVCMSADQSVFDTLFLAPFLP